MKFDFLPQDINSPVSDFSALILAELLVLMLAFMVVLFTRKERKRRVNYYYISMCFTEIVWLFSILCMRFISSDNLKALQFLDSLSNTGSVGPVLLFLITLCITTNDRFSNIWNLVLVFPALSIALTWTNDYHHLIYKNEVFSIVRSEIVNGPYLLINGIINYIFLTASILLFVIYAFRKKNKNAKGQAVFISMGAAVPMLVSALATFVPSLNLSITTTPISFVVLAVCNYIAIYVFHALDILPFATQQLLNWIGDSYVVVGTDSTVLSYNEPFEKTVRQCLPLVKGKNLDSIDAGNSKGVIYQILSAMRSSEFGNEHISFEHTFSYGKGDTEDDEKHIYIIEVTSLYLKDGKKRKKVQNDRGSLCGYIVLFKDITQLRRSMEQIQHSKERLMEQERLAMLGQMAGGFAHNLKTPIMSIAGSTSSIDSLVQEISDSIGNPQVTDDDYREIVNELFGLTYKIRESCSYMSEIISAVKGQAANANNQDDREFSVKDVVRGAEVLLKHEISKNGCTLDRENEIDPTLTVRGDMNSLTQILTNLIVNAVDAVKTSADKHITIRVKREGKTVRVSVIDRGPGLAPKVREKLFKEMVTTKGTHGTGLGLFISSTVIRGKFGGEMWIADCETGAEIGFTVPLVRGFEENKE